MTPRENDKQGTGGYLFDAEGNIDPLQLEHFNERWSKLDFLDEVKQILINTELTADQKIISIKTLTLRAPDTKYDDCLDKFK